MDVIFGLKDILDFYNVWMKDGVDNIDFFSQELPFFCCKIFLLNDFNSCQLIGVNVLTLIDSGESTLTDWHPIIIELKKVCLSSGFLENSDPRVDN